MAFNRRKKKDDTQANLRIAIVEADRCKPRKCKQECKTFCPVNRMGKNCIDVKSKSKICFISESLCIGCGICVKKCPFEAISIINLPKALESQTTHRYGPNSFKLHRLPTPRPGQVLGLVGTNGIGKSTALKILAGKMKPNLGKFDQREAPDWSDILAYFRGSELQNYFTKVLEDDLSVTMKPQFVDHIPRSVVGAVGDIIKKKDKRNVCEYVMGELDLLNVRNRQIDVLSGGELQRFAIAVVSVQKKDVYMFDEPSSYLDVKQRLNAARLIRSLVEGEVGQKRFVVVVEHDLSVLDYLSDYICVLYGVPGAYGVVTMPYGVREGINVFLAGYIPTENMRFRDVELTFKVAQTFDDDKNKDGPESHYTYPDMTRTLVPRKRKKKKKKKAGPLKRKHAFKLHVKAGGFKDSQIVVMLGENGTGKTTFIRMLAGVMKSDEAEAGVAGVPRFNISYKPQKIVPRFRGTVQQLLIKKCPMMYAHPRFAGDVIKPLKVDKLYDQEVSHLSGGELQRVAITLCLGKPADLYLIDEPSAFLDSEQRITTAKVIKRFIVNAKKTAFIVEHDFIMGTYLADRVVVYEGRPGIECTANSPQPLLSGMNTFLKQLSVTFRRDPTNFRPRINKMDSVKDREQKKKGNFFYMDDE